MPGRNRCTKHLRIVGGTGFAANVTTLQRLCTPTCTVPTSTCAQSPPPHVAVHHFTNKECVLFRDNLRCVLYFASTSCSAPSAIGSGGHWLLVIVFTHHFRCRFKFSLTIWCFNAADVERSNVVAAISEYWVNLVQLSLALSYPHPEQWFQSEELRQYQKTKSS